MKPSAPAVLVVAASISSIAAFGLRSAEIEITETESGIRIATSAIEAVVAKTGYVSGIAGGSLLDKGTGFRDAGFGLDIVDWLLEPGSDGAYRKDLPGDLRYDFGNGFHGNIPKRSIEGPQICTAAKVLAPRVIRGKDFVAVTQDFTFRLAAPGKSPGSRWEQTLVFPEGKRWFLAADRVVSANPSDALFLRIDLPGHIRHDRGDSFGEVYLSYGGRIPSKEFLADFPPDARFLYRRGAGDPPRRFIRAYRLRDPRTGRDGPWLAGMTLDPAAVHEAWCHQRGYVCMIEEIGGRPVRAGDAFGAAYVIGFFDSIPEMEEVYDRFAGAAGLAAEPGGWKLLRSSELTLGEMPPGLLRERLDWFQDQKFGLFLHWGIYSQWGCIESWPLVPEDTWARPDDLRCWIERGKDIARFQRDYWELKKTFDPKGFDPRAWARAARDAGMKYVMFTTKHHDGFSMFDTRLTDFRITAPDCPYSRSPRPDIAREVFDAFRAEGLGIGAYFSKADWRSPYYWSPDLPARNRNPNYDTAKDPVRWSKFVDFVHGQVEELATGYGPIDILWLDAGQVRPPDQDIRMDRLAALARRHRPDILIVDRTVGGRFEDYRTPEQEVPEKALPYVWESCLTMGTQWSNKPDDAYKPARTLIHLLVDIVAKGGNLLLNIGPGPDGRLPEPAVERLREIGAWMKINGEAIHGTRPLPPYKAGPVALTRRGGSVYGIVLGKDGEETIPERVFVPTKARPGSAVRLLGIDRDLPWTSDGAGTAVEIPRDIAKSPPCRHAWTLRLEAEAAP